jgi:hypothetical protein
MFSLDRNASSKSHSAYVADLRQRLQEAYKKATEATNKARNRQKTNYDRHARAATLEPGDRVFVRVLAFGGKHKLANKWEKEVYVVTKQPNLDVPVYTVRKELDPTQRELTLHRNHLLPIGPMQDQISGHPVQIETKQKQRQQKKNSNKVKTQAASSPKQLAENPALGKEEEESEAEFSVQLYLPKDVKAVAPPAADPPLAPRSSATPSDIVGDGHTLPAGEGSSGQNGDDCGSQEAGQPEPPTEHAGDEGEASGQDDVAQTVAPAKEAEEETAPEVESVVEMDMLRRSSRVRREPDRFQAGVYCVTQTETVDWRARMLALSELLSAGCILDLEMIANILKKLATK